MSRLKELKKANGGRMPPMPAISATYLLNHLMRIGPALPGGFGPIAVTEEAMLAYQVNRGIRLPAWEVDHIKGLSAIYVEELGISEAHDAPPPFDSEELRHMMAAANAGRMKASIRKMAAR